ncbi:HpcH/HpaI aldolase/citrate lyase family protein [Citricoccus sp. SGAir0253]|uniref:HpcH/HpaI aldolase family protein n=1 Tax=Citricoccus sp. SGAir0253 TaxID=2567881 RepID=UPI001FEFE07D|nr:aldolase/citrate lyase family protein [Citricoccus sp. SGAir0253]
MNVQTNSPELVEMVGLAGYDHVMIDWEHGSFGTDAVVSMIRAAEAVGLTPLVRVPANEEVWIKRVLDAGALGIVVPHVATPGQARAAVSAARYTRNRGQGARGACPSVRAAGHLTADWREFAQWSDENVFVAVAVESQEGVDALEEILSVEGIDALFLGSFDLAHEMGHFGDNSAPEVAREIDRIVDAARRASVPLFATLYRGSTLEDARQDFDRWIGAGARVVNAVSDRRLVLQSLGARISALREDRE